ncbi:protein of unknown function [Methylocella tundrae]|uniref:Uncharacterized protein n=1 Tax=Methylocella tundrae TaxID=227605 RepID=A0A4U8Z1D4_METTU|nr:protein of unknown function [Methylocella tundrae]
MSDRFCEDAPYRVVTTFEVFECPTGNHYSFHVYHCKSRLAIL